MELIAIRSTNQIKTPTKPTKDELDLVQFGSILSKKRTNQMDILNFYMFLRNFI